MTIFEGTSRAADVWLELPRLNWRGDYAVADGVLEEHQQFDDRNINSAVLANGGQYRRRGGHHHSCSSARSTI